MSDQNRPQSGNGQKVQSTFGFGTSTAQSNGNGLKAPYVAGFDEATSEMILRVPLTKRPELNSWNATAMHIAKAKKKLASTLGKNVAEITTQDLVDAKLPARVGEIVVGHRRALCASVGSQYAGAPLTNKEGTLPATYSGQVVRGVISIFTTDARGDEQEDDE